MTNARTQTSPQNNPQPQPQALVPLETTQQAQALVPASLEAAMQFSQWLAQSSLLPKSVNKEHDIFFIVCAGMELGFAPMAALRSLYVVNGRTALEAKAKAALCRQRGAALYFKKVEDTDKAVAWETHRKGDPSPSVQRFTIDDAKQAGLLGKGGPWTNYPRRMMSWKALGFLCDDTYPDIMLGVATKEDFDEEQIDVPPDRDGRRRRRARHHPAEGTGEHPAAATARGRELDAGDTSTAGRAAHGAMGRGRHHRGDHAHRQCWLACRPEDHP
jgi:hypothetical protein